MNLIGKYFDAILDIVGKVRESQRGPIDDAAIILAECVSTGGAIHIYDTGHMLDSELIGRAGGLFLMKPFCYALKVENPVRHREGWRLSISREGLARYAIGASNMRPGDVFLIGSVSGKRLEVVDLALTAKSMGITVIAVTSIEYSSFLPSEHSSGKRLFEVADLILDNCAPIGDAILEVEGLDVPICPASGITASIIMWAVTAALIEKLLAKGITPSVYRSINYPGEDEHNKAMAEIYAEKGY
ncbi:MAG: sugar isomerase domain-containing protein [Firmicutes bacterium]|nr:sugar isomerase domain-containing protein [Bacillota bacterium]